MVEVTASYRSTQAEITTIQASLQRQSASVQVRNGNSSTLLNRQERQIIDDVNISDGAIRQLEEAQILAQQLQEYLDYLQGQNTQNLPRITALNGEPTAVISGRSTNLAASITAGSIREETLEISASFDDDGNLEELSVTKTETTVEFVRAEFILEDRQFYAAVNA